MASKVPWVSEKQRRWGNSSAGHKALGDAGVAEWNAASKDMKLPKRLTPAHAMKIRAKAKKAMGM